MPATIVSITCWKMLGVILTLDGSLLKLYRPWQFFGIFSVTFLVQQKRKHSSELYKNSSKQFTRASGLNETIELVSFHCFRPGFKHHCLMFQYV